MNRKLMSAAALFMSGALALAGCSVKKNAVTGKTNDYDKTVVATVAGEDITLADFNFAYYSNAAQYQQYYAYMGIEDWESQELDGVTCGDYVRESAVTEMKQLIVTEQKAKEYGIEADADMIEDVRAQKDEVIEQNFGGDEGYQEYLTTYFTSDAAIEKYLLRASVLNTLFEQLSETGGECEVTAEEIEYNDDNYLKVKHVLIKTSDDVTSEDALAKANEVIAKLNAGEDMDKLVEEYGEDPGMESQDYYVFGEGEMVDEFYEASKALEIGAWSQEPVESSYGYHVIYRYALDESDDKFSELKTTKAQEKFMELLEDWTEGVEETIYDDVIDEALAAQKEETEAKEAELDALTNEIADDSGDASDVTDDTVDNTDADTADSGEEAE